MRPKQGGIMKLRLGAVLGSVAGLWGKTGTNQRAGGSWRLGEISNLSI